VLHPFESRHLTQGLFGLPGPTALSLRRTILGIPITRLSIGTAGDDHTRMHRVLAVVRSVPPGAAEREDNATNRTTGLVLTY
jgi:hypothetical protein